MDKFLGILVSLLFAVMIFRADLAYRKHYKLDDGNDTGKDAKNPADYFRNLLEVLRPILAYISWMLLMIYLRMLY